MWLRMGGRGIDAASNYLNEDEIGDAMEDCINEGKSLIIIYNYTS